MGPGKSLELPPPSNSRNFIDYPPSKSARKIAPTTPPVEFTELHRLPPPSKSARKIAPTTPPPSNSRNFIDYPPPPSKSARKIAPTTPPLEFTELHRLPPPLEIEPPFSEPWLRPWCCWNSLPPTIRCLADQPETFKKALKTYFMQQY